MRRFLIVSHRWLSLVLGLVLLVITTSGALLLYRPELQRALNSAAYDVSGDSPTTTAVQAMQTVTEAHPDFQPTGVWVQHGVYSVTDDETSWNVDPGTGRILGQVQPEPTWVRFLDNLHECLLTCEGEPGTVGFLAAEVPGSGWAGFDGAKITWGGLILGVLALLLLYLCLTGLWLWFPRPGRRRSAMSVRWKKGRFARDTDLHKVAGVLAIPFLLMWGLTGAGYELGFVEKGWYAVTPGSERELPDPVSAPVSGNPPDITPDQAVAAAQALHPDAELVNITLPVPDDSTSAYTFYFADGYDPYGQTEYPGDLGVYVDRHSGVAADFYGAPDDATAQVLWDQYNFPVHSGYLVDGWWRLVWLAMGLSPLLLAVTGLSTWLVRRHSRRQRRAAEHSGRPAPSLPVTVAEAIAEDPETAPDLSHHMQGLVAEPGSSEQGREVRTSTERV